MRWITIIIILLVFTVIGSGNLINYVSISDLNIRPEFLIILLAFLASKLEDRDAILASFLIGFMADISSSTMGPGIVSYGLIGSGFSVIKEILVLNRMRYQALTVFIISTVTLFAIEGLTYFKIHQISPSLITTVMGKSLYTAIVAPFAWKILQAASIFMGIKTAENRRRR